jgi:hypothetical protein
MSGYFLCECLSQVRLIEQITRNFKATGTIGSIASYFERKRKSKQYNKPRQKKRTEKISNVGKVGDGMTKIERLQTQNQKSKNQANEKRSQRRESNPTADPKFQACTNNWKHSKLF